MRTDQDSRHLGLFGPTRRKFDKSLPEAAAGRPLEPKLMQRSMGIMMSGLFAFALLAAAVLSAPSTSQAGEISIGISVRIGPPPIPVYAQPVCPGPGFMWTPGYWAYDPAEGYFWVPGTWVMAPAPLMLWTPGYWGWGGGGYLWHAGYWGPHVGFYGGINYGFGYNGRGFEGGEWRGRDFFYNRSVNNFGSAHFTHVYERTVVNNYAVNRVSYNGGTGGLSARPSAGELAAEHDHHIVATSLQQQHEVAAHGDRSQFASVNHGVPGVAATGRPGELSALEGGPFDTRRRPRNPETFHASNSAHTNAPTGGHSPNPGGGGTHDVMTAHSSSTPSHGPSTNEPKPAAGGFHGDFPVEKRTFARDCLGDPAQPTHAQHRVEPPNGGSFRTAPRARFETFGFQTFGRRGREARE